MNRKKRPKKISMGMAKFSRHGHVGLAKGSVSPVDQLGYAIVFEFFFLPPL